MNLTSYFIKHPVISLILNAMIVLLGVLCFETLSVREYPEVTFPTVSVTSFYNNASPELVESAVTNVLEDKLAGVEGVETMTSSSANGTSDITLDFRLGTNLDQAMVAIRDAISLARWGLPKEVKDPHIQRMGPSSGGETFFVVSLESSNMDFGALTHYAHINLRTIFRSMKGVASADVWGQPYTYEVTLDPKRMLTFGVNADEIYQVLSQSHFSLPVGKFRNEIPTTLNTELKTLEDYENLLIKEKNFNDPKHKQHPVFLKSIATIVQKTDDKSFRVRINGNPGLCIGIKRAKDANPLEVSNLLNDQVNALKESLPEGITMQVVQDNGEFIRASIKGIQSSIAEAILLVLIIVFLFLRNVRATLIPLITIPISMIGAFIFLKMFGYSLNIITLLAMVLAVGLVVDDAIVVLENISRHIEEGMQPVAAALKGAREIGFAIVAMTLTLTSVYAPIAFVHGVVGQLFIEFAVALAGSVLISGIVALTLSPLMCGSLLKNADHEKKRLWPQIDTGLNWISSHYERVLGSLIHRQKTALTIGISCLVVTILFFRILPQEMAPKEDRGLVGVHVPLIQGKDINTTEKNMILIEDMLKSIPEAQTMLTLMGNWGGVVILPLKPISERKRSPMDIIEQIRPLVSTIPSIDPHPWSDDSGLPGLDDRKDGENISLVVSTTQDYRTLFEEAEKARDALEKVMKGGKKRFENAGHNLKLDTPGYIIDLDQNRLSKLNLTPQRIAKTIEIFFSGDQSIPVTIEGVVSMLTLKGQIYPWTLNELYVTTLEGVAVSLGAVATMRSISQPERLFHYNQMRATIMTADLQAGETIDTAMPVFLKTVNSTLPSSYKKTWTGAAKAFKESSATMVMLFVLALVFVYAILAIQFENFMDPCIVLLTVPLACSGALFVVWLFGQSLSIYTQVGLITLIGLITKHGILIVEFTNQLRQEGLDLKAAIQGASTLRLRPILMTTAAMIVGAIPLVLSHDAGFEARRAIGAVLIGGLGFGTVFTLFIIPTLTYAIKSWQGESHKAVG